MLYGSGVPIRRVQYQATVWDQPGHLALKIGRDDAILLSADDQGRTANVRQDCAVVKRPEAVEQTQESLWAPRRREETQERPQSSIAGNCPRSTVQGDHAPVQVRPTAAVYETTPRIENGHRRLVQVVSRRGEDQTSNDIGPLTRSALPDRTASRDTLPDRWSPAQSLDCTEIIVGMLLDPKARGDRLPATEDQEPMAPVASTVAPDQLHGRSSNRPQAIAGPWNDDRRQRSAAELKPIHLRPMREPNRATPEPSRHSHPQRLIRASVHSSGASPFQSPPGVVASHNVQPWRWRLYLRTGVSSATSGGPSCRN